MRVFRGRSRINRSPDVENIDMHSIAPVRQQPQSIRPPGFHEGDWERLSPEQQRQVSAREAAIAVRGNLLNSAPQQNAGEATLQIAGFSRPQQPSLSADSSDHIRPPEIPEDMWATMTLDERVRFAADRNRPQQAATIVNQHVQQIQQQLQDPTSRPHDITQGSPSASAGISGGISPEAAQRLLDRANQTRRPSGGHGGSGGSGHSFGSPQSPNPAYAFADPVRLQGYTANQAKLNQQSPFDPQMEQLVLNLGAANAPMRYEDFIGIRENYRTPVDPRQAPITPTRHNMGEAWVQTTSGPVYMTPNSKVVYRPDQPVPEYTALANRPFLDDLKTGLRTGWNYSQGIEPGDNSPFSHSILEPLINKEYRSGFQDVMDANRLGTPGRIAAGLGSLAGDLTNYGTYANLVWRSHPMDVAQTHIIPNAVGKATGLDPRKDRALLKPYLIPTALGTGLAIHAGSGNIDLFNLFNTEEGPRVDGFKAQNSAYDTPTQTDNYPLALYKQLVPGGSSMLLPWEQFSQERPYVSYDQYKDYQNYLWGETGGQWLDGKGQFMDGLFKWTNNSIDAPEDAWITDPRAYEARIAGYRITPVGALAGLGALAGATTLIRARANRLKQARGLST